MELTADCERCYEDKQRNGIIFQWTRSWELTLVKRRSMRVVITSWFWRLLSWLCDLKTVLLLPPRATERIAELMH